MWVALFFVESISFFGSVDYQQKINYITVDKIKKSPLFSSFLKRWGARGEERLFIKKFFFPPQKLYFSIS